MLLSPSRSAEACLKLFIRTHVLRRKTLRAPGFPGGRWTCRVNVHPAPALSTQWASRPDASTWQGRHRALYPWNPKPSCFSVTTLHL